MTNIDTLPTEQRQRCEVWTRVMGYHRPVSQYNVGKRAEHRERHHFTERAAALAPPDTK
ncbi:oxidoreductase [Halomonas sp. DQ26W]|uniref:anaerobic ribonucleoside-triphosphate reductase n=1 Tax=Halomonas sp. DQ26W TaxID=2282311 RepID=UPI000DF791CA|nr:anaerobic ribonucleoside-triphosphate reductase [Halomonas sp. DQ26W]RDB44281.1 oxidoreductase [Halomonas sp. DQ26W]